MLPSSQAAEVLAAGIHDVGAGAAVEDVASGAAENAVVTRSPRSVSCPAEEDRTSRLTGRRP